MNKFQQLMERIRLFLATNLMDYESEFNTVQFIFTVVVCGIIGGLVASLYLFILESVADLIWGIIFNALKDIGTFGPHFPEYNYVWLGSLFLILPLCILVFIFPKAETGEFAEAVTTLHEEGRIPPRYVVPMFVFSILSVASGAGVGPEAPILVIGGGILSFLGEKLQLNKRSLRNFALCGTYAILSAFFGSPVSGIHALEFPHRIGIQYFEALPVGVASSFISSTIFHFIFSRYYGDVFRANYSLPYISPFQILTGIGLGIVSACICIVYWFFVIHIRKFVVRFKLRKRPYLMPIIPWIIFSVAGMLLPPVLFWGEPDIQNYIDLGLTPMRYWRGGNAGIIPLPEPYSVGVVLLIGFVKMITLSWCVTHGVKGGILFPLFAVGACFGQAAVMILGIDQSLGVSCVMAATQAGLTRTPIASSLVTVFLFNGFPSQLLIPIAGACFTCYFITFHFPLFTQQKHRGHLVLNSTENFEMGELSQIPNEKSAAPVIQEEEQFGD